VHALSKVLQMSIGARRHVTYSCRWRSIKQAKRRGQTADQMPDLQQMTLTKSHLHWLGRLVKNISIGHRHTVTVRIFSNSRQVAPSPLL